MNGALCAIEQIDTHPPRPSLDTGNSLCYRTQPLRGPRGGHFGRIAQLVEQLTLNQRVPGSSPGAPTKKLQKIKMIQTMRGRARGNAVAVSGQCQGSWSPAAPVPISIKMDVAKILYDELERAW